MIDLHINQLINLLINLLIKVPHSLIETKDGKVGAFIKDHCD
jgi:hypothetical protein